MSCDYGAPTTRTRFYMVARCDGKPIVWAKPTHAPKNSEAVKSGKLKPYHTAAECIDWSIPAQSIFERDKPLAENSLTEEPKWLFWSGDLIKAANVEEAPDNVEKAN